MENLSKALFLDLDGTLITTRSGMKFPIHSEDWKLIPETLDAIKYFHKQGYRLIIVSNQGGIEQGYLNESVFIKKIEKVCATIEKSAKLKSNCISYYYCTKMIDYSRKPYPGMAYEAALEYDLNLKDSVMFGDYKTDKEFAELAGISTYYDISEIRSIDWLSK